MPSLKSILGFVLMGVLVIPASHAQEREDCAYDEGRRIEDLPAALKAHKAWLENKGWSDPEVPGRAKFCNANLSNANLSSANLDRADLREANLARSSLASAGLRGADLERANLQGANLNSADLVGAYLFGANLEGALLALGKLQGADLTIANLQGANLYAVNLEGANLEGANLKGADLSSAILARAALSRTVLEGAKLSGTDLSGALYQPATAPAQGYLSGLTGLRSVTYCPGEHSGLVQLRTTLKAAGLRGLEREATYVLESTRTRYALESWSPVPDDASVCDPPGRNPLAAIEGVLRLVFFEWTTGYGLYYGRPIVIILVLIVVFALVYLPPIVISPKRSEQGGIYQVWPEGRIEPSTKGFQIASDPIVERVNSRGFVALWHAFYFSVVSAFHLGWRDLNVGTWIARLQPREYALRAKGWVRVVSGVQSLISVYLIAMWVLTYFGRPFG